MEMKVQARLFLAAILRPMVRFCLKRSLKIQDIEEQLRKLLVEEASAAIEKSGGEVSVSKISIVTGVHRAEVGRLLTGEERPKGKHDVLYRVLSKWRFARQFRDRKNGEPKALTYQGLSSEFATLVAGVSKEISHYTILFELERVGLIEFQEEQVLLKGLEYIPQGDLGHGIGVLVDDVETLIDTVELNLTSKAEQPDLHLRTHFDNIDARKLPSIRKWILGRGARFHAEVCDFLAAFDRDVHPELEIHEVRARVSVTSFALGAIIEPIKQLKPRKRGRKKRTE